MNIAEIYNALENGNKPEQKIVRDEDGRITGTITRSQRQDVIVVEHLKDNKYKAIRIIPKTQSQNSAMRDMVRSPTNSYSKDFQHCKYQLLWFEDSNLREKEAPFSHQTIHLNCRWNSKPATRLRTAQSARSLQTAWSEYL